MTPRQDDGWTAGPVSKDALGVPSLADLADIRSALLSGLYAHYGSLGHKEVRVPTVVPVTGACENVATLFRVESGLHPQQGRPSSHEPLRPSKYLTQTGQLALEHMLAEANGCWCHTGSFRDDTADYRHLQEFELLEEEFALVRHGHQPVAEPYSPELLFGDLLQRLRSAVLAALAAVREHLPVGALLPTDHIIAACELEFPQYQYDEALDIINSEHARRGIEPLLWGSDLHSRDEFIVIDYAARSGTPLPVFITHFPAAIKFFNMKLDPADNRRVLSADLLLPFAGEAAGAAVREDHYETLRIRLEQSSMMAILREQYGIGLSVFRPYLDLIRLGRTPPHAGYGLGLERLLQFIFRLSDIRQVSLPYRLTELSAGRPTSE